MGQISSFGHVMDVVKQDHKIAIASQNASVEIFDLKQNKRLYLHEFSSIKDFANRQIPAKVYSVDMKNGDLLAVVQTQGFYRKLVFISEGKEKVLIDKNQKFMIKKARFVDDELILIALMTNEIMLFNRLNGKIIYKISLNHSQFSDFALDEKHERFASSSESGEIFVVETKSGKILKKLAKNVDNVYKIDFKNDHILSAGQDRRAYLYNLKTDEVKQFKANFLIYACALHKSAKYLALPMDENNEISVFYEGEKIDILKGAKSALNTIIFLDEKHILASSDDKNIIIWSIK